VERNELVQHLAAWHDLPEGLSQGERTEDLRAWHDRDHLTIDPATHRPYPQEERNEQ
jgi:hypothetical protein